MLLEVVSIPRFRTFPFLFTYIIRHHQERRVRIHWSNWVSKVYITGYLQDRASMCDELSPKTWLRVYFPLLPSGLALPTNLFALENIQQPNGQQAAFSQLHAISTEASLDILSIESADPVPVYPILMRSHE
jgi:hypothetical protein